MKKILDSDWLRAIQFKQTTCVKSVTPVQITHRNSRLWFLKEKRKFSKPMISRRVMTKILCGNSEKKVLLSEKKNGFKKDFRHFLHENFVMF